MIDASFETGHLDALAKDGWVIGHFAPPPRYSAAVEVKWAFHERGSLASKPWAACATATTLAVLISGRFEIKFTNTRRDSVTLLSPGDYVLFGPGIPHKSEALEDSAFLTIRWPSAPDDCRAVLTE
jgi:hypothetical protein